MSDIHELHTHKLYSIFFKVSCMLYKSYKYIGLSPVIFDHLSFPNNSNCLGFTVIKGLQGDSDLHEALKHDYIILRKNTIHSMLFCTLCDLLCILDNNDIN